MWLIGLLALLTLGYAGLILHFKKGWDALPGFTSGPRTTPLPFVTVLIPARNEEKNIGALLDALSKQTYPQEKREVIVVDDHSTDRTAIIARSFSFVKLIELTDDCENSYKKRAIEKGIEQASAPFIICTDADCVPEAEWLETIGCTYLQNECAFIAAPVLLENNSSVLGRFQTLDFLVMQGITAAGIQQQSIYMANGANMSYPKKVFEWVGGYKESKQLASGDDFFLLHKIQKEYPSLIHFIKSEKAIIRTQALPTWSEFFQQRIRWASKSSHYDNRPLKLVLVLVGIYNLSLLVTLALSIVCPPFLLLALASILVKSLIEWPFVHAVAKFFKVPISGFQFLLFQPLHIIYIPITGILSFQKKYVWKGRKVH
jgi:biofilm PGA synthesis N-glycosyltransferase PgaC